MPTSIVLRFAIGHESYNELSIQFPNRLRVINSTAALLLGGWQLTLTYTERVANVTTNNTLPYGRYIAKSK